MNKAYWISKENIFRWKESCNSIYFTIGSPLVANEFSQLCHFRGQSLSFLSMEYTVLKVKFINSSHNFFSVTLPTYLMEKTPFKNRSKGKNKKIAHAMGEDYIQTICLNITSSSF